MIYRSLHSETEYIDDDVVVKRRIGISHIIVPTDREYHQIGCINC